MKRHDEQKSQFNSQGEDTSGVTPPYAWSLTARLGPPNVSGVTLQRKAR